MAVLREGHVCPKCGGDSKIYNVRQMKNYKGTTRRIRRRECTVCGFCWVTVELMFKQVQKYL